MPVVPVIFFFQAEDGIRARDVTGVQTCAIPIFARVWLEDARDAGIRLPEAVALATVDAGGRPSVRHVLLRGLDERGFVFYTNYESRKGRELDANPWAGMAFYWRELDRQVCVSGTVGRTSREESEEYFRTRPREARVGAWASRQSEVASSREELDAGYREIDARYPA